MDLNSIPRRKRRFYRKDRIMHHMIQEIKNDAKLKLEEKKKVLEGLKKKLEQAKEEEINVLAENLFNQSQKKDLGKIAAIEIQKNRIKNPEREELNFNEIAENIYLQLMAEKEIKKWKERNLKKNPVKGIKEKIEELEETNHPEKIVKEEQKHEESEEEKLSISDLGLDTKNPLPEIKEGVSQQQNDDFSLEGLQTDFGLEAKLKKKKNES